MEYESETQIVGSCLCLLSMLGIYSWRNNTGALKNRAGRIIHYGKVGSSDILGILPDGRFLAVECKTAKGKLSPHQRTFLEQIKKNNGVAVVVRNTDELLEKIKGLLEA